MTTSSDGTTIAYDQAGDGPALVLVGGALNDRHTPAALAAGLAPAFRVVTYDRRGRGDSGDTPPHALEREVDDLSAVIAAAGGSASVFGHSSGAHLALSTALAGAPIDKLALYEPPYIVDGSRPLPPPGYLPTLRELLDADRRGDAVELFMTRAVGTPAELVAQMRTQPWFRGLEALAHTLPYDEAVMEGHLGGNPLPAEWAALTTPTLVMGGANSQSWMQHSMEALAALLPNTQRHTFPGADHAVAPEALAPVLVKFFAA